jgi:hypothetical protein
MNPIKTESTFAPKSLAPSLSHAAGLQGISPNSDEQSTVSAIGENGRAIGTKMAENKGF